MNKIVCGMGLVLGTFFTVVGCGGSPQEPSVEAPVEDVEMRESAESSGKSETAAGLVSCSYVQYCDAPGAYGTVCKYTNGCDEGSSYRECLSEVRSICGSSPVYPAPIFYHAP